ncbi:class I SAM-dependent methyltransferase [soil metagenome]
MSQSIRLKAGRDHAVRIGHPWLFSGALEQADARHASGATVRIESHEGEPLAWAAWSPQSQIRARIWTTQIDRPIDHAFFKRVVGTAVERRRRMGFNFHAPGGVRVLHGESDGVPGFVCDAFIGLDTRWLVIQVTSAGAEKWRDALVDALVAHTGIERVYERSDAEVRKLEGLESRQGVLRGAAPAGDLVIEEGGVRLLVDIERGHKTGFYLDQRDSRALAARLAPGRQVLNAFCYTGAFSMAALKAGASHVESIDASADALAIGARNAALNGFDPRSASWIRADVFEHLRELDRAKRRFGLIVLDPPKLAASAAHVEKAARASKDLTRLGLGLLEPGGALLTFSCSGSMTRELFRKIAAAAAADAGVDAIVVGSLGAAADHPVRLAFPEGDYLKGLHLERGASPGTI